ncbi:LacI family DNA-binding transcriptional regulator [Kribbella swartbergensis]
MATSHDVARLAGVSQPTVSRALRDDPRVSEATKQQVRAAAEALGYAPNAIGRALSTGRSTRVGLVVTDLHNQFYQYMIAPMHEELTKLGYELVLITESSESAPVADHVVANGLCGVVLTTTLLGSVLPVRLHDRHVPFVYFNRIARNVEADSVTVDPVPGVTELVEAVAAYGHTKVGAIFGPRDTSTGELRESVVRDLLQDKGISLLNRNVVHGSFDFDTGHRGAGQLLAQPDPPTLILCANDVVALGALNAAAERGVDVPGRLSIVGFDDLPSSAWALVQLSTVAYDLDEMSREAVRLLVARVEGRGADTPQHTVFGTWYVPRATLGPAAG